VAINYRATETLKMKVVNTKTASEVKIAIVSTLEEWKPWLPTIAADNGKDRTSYSTCQPPANCPGVKRGFLLRQALIHGKEGPTRT